MDTFTPIGIFPIDLYSNVSSPKYSLEPDNTALTSHHPLDHQSLEKLGKVFTDIPDCSEEGVVCIQCINVSCPELQTVLKNLNQKEANVTEGQR